MADEKNVVERDAARAVGPAVATPPRTPAPPLPPPPPVFDEAKRGELVSRLAADTTQIKAGVGASVSIALRTSVLFVGAAAMMVVTSARLPAFVPAAIPVIVLPLYGFGRAVRRRSRWPQDTPAA